MEIKLVYENLFVNQGADYYRTFTVRDASNNSPVDLTDFAVKSQFSKSYMSSTRHEFTAVVSDAANGQVTISIDDADTRLVASGRYLYDIIIRDSADNVYRVVEGQVEFRAAITEDFV